MAAADLTAARVREVLHYDPLTGVFTWRVKTCRKVVAGTVAGCLSKANGYVLIRIDGALHLAHRLAFLWMTGAWPKDMVDHRDGVRNNNRWGNLRNATGTLNSQNQRSARGATKSGILGVTWFAQTGKWRAEIKTPGRKLSLGYFSTKDEAQAAYIAAKREHHEGCTV